MKKAACRRLKMHLGEEVDIIPYFLGNVQYEKNCNAFCLSRMPLCVAVPVMHSLNSKGKLSLADLDGETVVTLADEVNVHYVKINEKLCPKAPNATIHDVTMFDYTTFNFALQKNATMLVCAFLKDVFPMMQLHELQEKTMLPYGIYYAQTPSPEAMAMLERFRKTGVSGEEKDAQWMAFL